MKLPKTPRKSGPSEILHRRNAQFSTLGQVSAVISQTDRLDKALDATLDQLLELTEADIGSIHILEPKTNQLKLISSRGISQGFVHAEDCIPVGDCLCGRVAQSGELISSPDLSTEIRLTRSACRDEPFGSIVSIPLKSRDRVLGIMTIYAKRLHAFKNSDQGFLILVGRQIGVAVENAQLYSRARETAVMEERGLIARELHDGIAQNLAYLNLETKRLEDLLEAPQRAEVISRLDGLRQVILETYEDVRELLVDFRAGFKEGESLQEVLGRHIGEFSRRTGIVAELTHSSETPELPFATEVQLFLIIQEALSNVRKHAVAKSVTISLSLQKSCFEVRVRDDGRGFDPQDPAGTRHPHIGLEIMQERAAKLRGELIFESQPGRGVSVVIRIPLEASEE